MILRAMPAVVLLVAGPPMPNRSIAMTADKKEYPGPPGWGLGHKANKLTSVKKKKNFTVAKPNDG